MMKVKEKESLKSKTSFRIGGEASYFVEVYTKDDVAEAVRLANDKGLPVFVLGDGTDILMSDKEFRAVVVKFENKDFEVQSIGDNKFRVVGGAGLNWDEFVGKAVDIGLGGIECLSGIPGTVGASPVQNIGAYGQEVKNTIEEVEVYDTKEGKFKKLLNSECDFSYRDSVFKKEKRRYLIFQVVFILEKEVEPTLTYESLTNYLEEKGIKKPTLSQTREAVLSIRKMKLEDPKVVGNAGSFFKNPVMTKEEFLKKQNLADAPHFEANGKVKLQAGWLIDKAGWKGKMVGGAMVSERNALVIVNATGNASASDVYDLADRIIADIKDKFDLTLEPEVQYINF